MARDESIAVLSLEEMAGALESVGRFERGMGFERRGMPADGWGMRLRGAVPPLHRAL